ncbi:hypothetical protein ABLB69_11900 [Xenorhabdus khoisanae]
MDLLEQDSKRFIDNLFLAGIAISANISTLALTFIYHVTMAGG